MTKILCISLGSIGKRHLRNTRELLPDAEIAVYRQHTRSEQIVPEGADAIFHSIDEALAFAPDAVLISSPASEHINKASLFIEKNIPVFLEKPLAAKSDDLKNIVSLSESSSGFVMVGYVLRFLPALHRIKKLIDDGILGKIYTARVEVGQYLPDWRPSSDYRDGVSAQKKLGGGALLELSHEIDYATWLFGFPKFIQCSCSKLSDLEIDVEDSAHIIMEYSDKRVLIQLDFLQKVANMEIEIVAEKVTLKANLIKEEIFLYSPEYPNGEPIDCDKLPNGNDIYLRQFDFFFKKSLSDYQARYNYSKTFSQYSSISSAASVLEIVDIAKKASDTGVKQKIQPIV